MPSPAHHHRFQRCTPPSFMPAHAPFSPARLPACRPACRVNFRVVVFRPFREELLVGKVHKMTR